MQAANAHKMPHKLPFDPAATGPLDGVRVLDLSRLVAGNMLSLQLADFGADVIKVEPPVGRSAARLARRRRGAALEDLCAQQALDRAQPPPRRRQGCAQRLVATADVLIENFRPGTLEEMGLGPDVLLGRKSRPRHRAGVGLRPDRPLCAAARLRHPGRGDERLCRPHRLCRPRAGAAAARARRHDRRPLRRLRRGDGAARPRPRRWRARRTGHRSLAAGIDVFGARAGSRDLPAYRRREGAHRQRFQHLGAAQRLPLRRRQLRRAVGLDRHHGAAGVRGDRPPRHDRGRALPHQRARVEHRALVDEAVGAWFAGKTPRRGAAADARGARHRRAGLHHRRRDGGRAFPRPRDHRRGRRPRDRRPVPCTTSCRGCRARRACCGARRRASASTPMPFSPRPASMPRPSQGCRQEGGAA